MNRILNSDLSDAEHGEYMQLLERVVGNATIEAELREQAQHFIEYQHGADNMSGNANAQRPEAGPRDHAGSGTTMFSMAPMPSISTRITSPTLRNCGGFAAAPMPEGVPVARMSPGSSVITVERCAICCQMS